LPHDAGHGPQSPGHARHVSPPSHTAFPHTAGHGPQSLGHVTHVSVESHVWLLHVAAHGPQSPGQLSHVSPDVQLASPHTLPPPLVPVDIELPVDMPEPLLPDGDPPPCPPFFSPSSASPMTPVHAPIASDETSRAAAERRAFFRLRMAAMVRRARARRP
jgi:hypothetical protein